MMTEKIKILLFVLIYNSMSPASSGIEKCAKVALYAERNAINQKTSFLGLKVDPDGIIQSPGQAWAAKYSNDSNSTKIKFKDDSEIVFEKSDDRKIKSVSVEKRKSTMTEDCNLDQIVNNDTELLYDRRICLEFAKLYRDNGMDKKDVLACGSLINSVSKMIEARNHSLKSSGLSISSISDKNPLGVGGFVFSCADQLSFEKIEDGLIKGTIYPYSRELLKSAFFFSHTPQTRQKKIKAPAVQ